ncbi:MAG: hypothetical protein OTI36_21610, partial [Beijerinckiaceae bacterium]|nr:hypothetical protein [Beijerinckiaceae bacterium]
PVLENQLYLLCGTVCVVHLPHDKRLFKRVKLKIYATFIISILVWGLGAWKLDKKLWGKLVV